MLLEGIFPAITTPFYPDGRLYLRKLEHNVERYSRTPCSGLVILGSTGEAVMLSDDESRDILRHAASAAAPDKVLLAGIGRESLTETLSLAEYAAERDYDAVLVRTPHYYAPYYGSVSSTGGLVTYYRALADRSALPVILYSIPKFTHYEIPVDIVAELAAHPNIIAIKDSSGSLERLAALVAATSSAPRRSTLVTSVFTAVTSRMITAQEEMSLASGFLSADLLTTGMPPPPSAVPPIVNTMRKKDIGFQVLCGSAESLLTALEAGVSGGILAFAAPAPQACQEVYIAWKENDRAVAQEKQQRIVEASRAVTGKFGIAGIKHACDLNGYYGGVPRIPLLPLSAEQQSEVASAMAPVRN
jgi:4-hydroxy-2-oxoglutarate aldolase